MTLLEGGRDRDQAEGGDGVVHEVDRRGDAGDRYHLPRPRPKEQRESVCGRLAYRNAIQETGCKAS